MTKLTDKQRAFVANKAAGCTNRDAAIAAGYAVAGASVAADKLMANPAIRAALKIATKATPGVDIKSGAPAMPRERYADPKTFLLDVMNLAGLPIAMRADAAKQLLPYMHARMGETGKKETMKENARAIARGRHKFATQAPPQLTVVRNSE
ncbi:terminase small subunit [Lysobacter sp. CCNWLW3]|uniref:terminase small subunit n=1 Tax=unclassified Lysobacter TaxID=2635362 RepID=UPI002FCE6FD7